MHSECIDLCIYRSRAIWGVSFLYINQTYITTKHPNYDEKWFIEQGV